MKKDLFAGIKAILKQSENQHLSTKTSGDFKSYLADMKYQKQLGKNELKTYSPLDEVVDFEQHGLQKVREVSHDDMLANSQAMKKLLANMLSQCQPGSLSEDDVQQLSGINGRELQVD